MKTNEELFDAVYGVVRTCGKFDAKSGGNVYTFNGVIAISQDGGYSQSISVPDIDLYCWRVYESSGKTPVDFSEGSRVLLDKAAEMVRL